MTLLCKKIPETKMLADILSRHILIFNEIFCLVLNTLFQEIYKGFLESHFCGYIQFKYVAHIYSSNLYFRNLPVFPNSTINQSQKTFYYHSFH
jgi:hypothetical protein